MNEPPASLSTDGEWYFSRDGQQSGPLTYDELKAKADEGALMPRLDLVWKEGMTDWRPVGEIEGLFDRRPQASETTDQPYSSPEADLMYEQESTGEWPGTRRRGYLFGIFIFPLLWNVVLASGTTLAAKQLGKPIPEPALLGLYCVPLLVVLWCSIQRFPNLGMSRFWILGNLIPILNIWLGYRCFACPAGYAVHKKLDGIGVFLAILYWLFFVLAALVVAAAIAAALGMIGDADFQQKMREMIEAAEKARPTLPVK